MIVRVVRKLLSRVRRIGVAQHGITPAQIDSDAKKVVAKLQKNGYESYIVGGAVRDLLVGITPKDFDISTKATPQQVRHLFNRARIIGRRFRIVHVPVGRRAYIEVTTFRAGGDAVVQNASGRILHDNIFGDASDDATRRDFSCNALFYNPADEKIIDYVGGYQDIKKRRLRVIGSPQKRFRQDPVRILRALRLESKLSLSLDLAARRAMSEAAPLLHEISETRLFEEIIKMLNSGHAFDIFHHCASRHVSPHFFPVITKLQPLHKTFLKDADLRFANDRKISVSFLVAAFFWPQVDAEWRKQRREGIPPYFAMERARAVADFSANSIVPRKIVTRIYDFYALLARMEGRLSHGRAARVVHHPLFRRACAFNRLRGAEDIAKWWQDYAAASNAKQKNMLANLSKTNDK